MLKRKIEKILEEWKNQNSHKALCIVGARQIGKTTAVRTFAAKHYECFLELNFIENPAAKEIFQSSHGVEEILISLTAYSEHPLIPHKTLILLDEIQECPEARTAVKFLVEEGGFDYIETGSLLGVKVSEIRSYPVGYETLVNMYPLDFEEFLWAMNIQTPVIDYLKTCCDSRKPVAEAVHKKILSVFRYYIAVGGMPEAVQTFVSTHDLGQVILIQQRILDGYRLDITKYAQKSEKIKILDLFNSIPGQLNEKNPRFYLTRIDPNARLNRYESSLSWLIEAGTVLPSYGLEEPQCPLALNEKRSSFRLFMSDIGLLCAALGNQTQLRIINQDSSLNAGCIFENVFAQQLVANGFELYYFNSKKYGEIDFVTALADQADLIEIKSGHSFASHPALDKVRRNPAWTFSRSIVFCESNVQTKGAIDYLPWYMIQFYKKPEQGSLIVDFNFESLSLPEE